MLIRVQTTHHRALKKEIRLECDTKDFSFQVQLPDGRTITGKDGEAVWQQAMEAMDECVIDRWMNVIEVYLSNGRESNGVSTIFRATRKQVGIIRSGQLIERSWQDARAAESATKKKAPYAHTEPLRWLPTDVEQALVSGTLPVFSEEKGHLYLPYSEETWENLQTAISQFRGIRSVLKSTLMSAPGKLVNLVGELGLLLSMYGPVDADGVDEDEDPDEDEIDDRDSSEE